jgi:bifunctional non-homologous end joining protein LigD
MAWPPSLRLLDLRDDGLAVYVFGIELHFVAGFDGLEHGRMAMAHVRNSHKNRGLNSGLARPFRGIVTTPPAGGQRLLSTGMLARRSRTDGFVDPCIPTLAHKPPSGPGWGHEIKHDGYRLIVRREGAIVRLFTRRGYDWTDRYPAIASAAAKLRAESFTVDGEAAVVSADGVAIFDALHRRHKPATPSCTRSISWNSTGEDLRPLPLSARKAKLARLLARKPAEIVFNEHTDEDGATVFRHACATGLEGIVSKRLTAPYRSGSSRDWIKVKNPDSPAMVRAREHFARLGK